MYGDGAVPEGDLLEALNRLLLRQALAHALNKPGWLVDVVSLSLGYYHELPADFAYDQLLIETLRALGELGVAIVAAAGNDATARHFYPAGFAPHAGGAAGTPVERDVLPVISVGALNPDLRSIALFSNAGDWVCCHRQGAALVSTMPTTFDGSLQPAAAVRRSRAAGCGPPSTRTTSTAASPPGAARPSPRPILAAEVAEVPVGLQGAGHLRPGDHARPRLERAGTAGRPPASEASALANAGHRCPQH